MRKQIQNRLKEYFSLALLQCREALGISQEEMAHRLSMATRSYIALEHGESCCGAATFVLFLLEVCPDSEAFLSELRSALSGQEIA